LPRRQGGHSHKSRPPTARELAAAYVRFVELGSALVGVICGHPKAPRRAVNLSPPVFSFAAFRVRLGVGRVCGLCNASDNLPVAALRLRQRSRGRGAPNLSPPAPSGQARQAGNRRRAKVAYNDIFAIFAILVEECGLSVTPSATILASTKKVGKRWVRDCLQPPHFASTSCNERPSLKPSH
jgi:hypothetical protein